MDDQKRTEIYFPNDYEEVFKDSVCMVTGVGKSGTTVAVLLLASMEPSYHVYEPALLKIIPPISNDNINFIVRNAILFDYLYPIVRGLRICDHEFQAVNSEWQWATQKSERSKRAWSDDFQGVGAFQHLFREHPLFLINMLNGLPRIEQWEGIFPGMHTIHVVRNGFDIVASETVRRAWHGDEYYFWPMQFVADWIDRDSGYPYYIEDEAKEYWKKWTPQTRSAHIWRIQVNMYPPTLKYEQLVDDPERIASFFLWKFKRLKPTPLTDMWIDRLKMRKIPEHGLTLNDIEEPERNKFKETMERLGYL